MRADCVTWYHAACTEHFPDYIYVWDMHSAVLYLSTAYAYNMKTWPFCTSCQTDLHQIKLLLDEKSSLQQCCMLN